MINGIILAKNKDRRSIKRRLGNENAASFKRIFWPKMRTWS